MAPVPNTSRSHPLYKFYPWLRVSGGDTVQFSSDAFTGILKRENIAISIVERGRAFDNIFG